MSAPEPIVWLNGALLLVSQARISPFDRGFTVGCAAFETLRAHGGKLFASTRHWNRLVRSCKILGIQSPLCGEFIQSMEETLKANHLREARVRFTVTAGDGEKNAASKIAVPTMLVHAVPAQRYAATERVVTVPWPRNERGVLVGAKCASYADNIAALTHAHSRGAGEAIFANTRGELCEGATTNVFVVRDGLLLTPPTTSGCLPGITREIVLDLCRDHEIPFAENDLPLAALKDADEFFLTSSTRGVQPVEKVDDKTLPHSPGPVTRKVARLYHDLAIANNDP